MWIVYCHLETKENKEELNRLKASTLYSHRTYLVASGLGTPKIVRVCPTLKAMSLTTIPCAEKEQGSDTGKALCGDLLDFHYVQISFASGKKNQQ